MRLERWRGRPIPGDVLRGSARAPHRPRRGTDGSRAASGRIARTSTRPSGRPTASRAPPPWSVWARWPSSPTTSRRFSSGSGRGTLAVDSDIITTLLEARDHLAAMVEAEAAGSPIPASSELTQRLVALLRGPAQHAPRQPRRPQSAAPARPAGGRPRRPAPNPAPPTPADGNLRPRPSRPGERRPAPAAGIEARRARAPRKKAPKMSPPPEDGARSAGPTHPSSPDGDGKRPTGSPDARARYPPARHQSPGRARRAPRAGRDPDRDRPGPVPPSMSSIPSAATWLDDHDRDRCGSANASVKSSCSSPKTAPSRSSG